MNYNKSAIGILFALLIVVGVGFATIFFISPNSGRGTSTLSPTPEPEPVQMRVIASSSVWKPGNTYEVYVALENLPGKKITAATTHLEYDPKLLKVVDVENGQLWSAPEILSKSIDNEEGEVIYSIVPTGTPDFTGEESLAIVKFIPINTELIFTNIALGDRSVLASPGLNELTPSFAEPLTVTLTK